MKDHGAVWDAYVDREFPGKRARGEAPDDTPGSEWSTPELWRGVLQDTLFDRVRRGDPRLIEIAPGAGKQSRLVLDHYLDPRILAFDVSRRFLDAFEAALAEEIGRRVFAQQLGDDHREIIDAVERHGLTRKIDALYSFDSMVHVDFQQLMNFLITALFVLRKGGVIVMDLADMESEAGFERLIADAPKHYARHGAPSAKFMFAHRAMVETALPRLGFEVEIRPHPLGNLLVIATLRRRRHGLDALGSSITQWR
jgi:hypothetical protein